MKHLSKYFTITAGILTMAVVACSPISGREFQDASLHHKIEYCKSEKLKKSIYDQETDPRCGIVLASKKEKVKFFDGGCELLTDPRCLLGEIV